VAESCLSAIEPSAGEADAGRAFRLPDSGGGDMRPL